ncbi:uncharacterized protein LOC142741466 isoform X2 [Rhinoderma darwinii]|uniref:uncharacterized protein LOC142741446 isoform X2 n=1 Tax=Rhinoderma darwinii TaxID=43563 RepID=UPI003F67385A
MDFRAREKAWLTKLDTVFRDEPMVGDSDTLGNFAAIRNSLKALLHKRTKTWWNKAFLEKYLQRGLIPRGLRIQVFPTLNSLDESFISRWEDNCRSSSQTFMELLIGLDKQSLELLDVEIDKVQAQLKAKCSEDEWIAISQQFNTEMDKWEKGIQDIKSRKFQRDLNDKLTNRMYKWQYSKAQNRVTSRSPSVSSGSSFSESDDNGQRGKTRSGMEYRRYNIPNQRGRQRFRTDERRTQPYGFDPPGRQRDEMRRFPISDNQRMKVINLSTHQLSSIDIGVLSRGLTFAPSNQFDAFTAIKDLHLFARGLLFKRWFHRKTDNNFTTPEEIEALHSLEQLLNEQESHETVHHFIVY